jgi:hypothetical protein
MELVRELRALALLPRSKTALQNRMTQEGIFSLHFASEYLLRDVVKDSTIDVMHVYLCGWSRYLVSWVTDAFIPRDFSWDQLNKVKRALLPLKRVPDLERSKGDSRGSLSIHLNAAQTMHFTLDRSSLRL